MSKMSKNCIICIKNKRTGTDLMCDKCRKIEYEKQFRKTFRLKKEFRDNPECQLAFEYAAQSNKLSISEINYIGINYIGAIIERYKK